MSAIRKNSNHRQNKSITILLSPTMKEQDKIIQKSIKQFHLTSFVD
jgi:hypothetical protein